MLVKQLRVLIVEDDANSRAVLQRALEPQAAIVTVADTGEQAVTLFRPGAFDVVLMDLRLPAMSGYDVTRRIRDVEARENAERTPVVVVSAHHREWEAAEARDAGADFHLAKPVSILALLRTIDVVAQVF